MIQPDIEYLLSKYEKYLNQGIEAYNKKIAERQIEVPSLSEVKHFREDKQEEFIAKVDTVTH